MNKIPYFDNCVLHLFYNLYDLSMSSTVVKVFLISSTILECAFPNAYCLRPVRARWSSWQYWQRGAQPPSVGRSSAMTVFQSWAFSGNLLKSVSEGCGPCYVSKLPFHARLKLGSPGKCFNRHFSSGHKKARRSGPESRYRSKIFFFNSSSLLLSRSVNTVAPNNTCISTFCSHHCRSENSVKRGAKRSPIPNS